MIFDRIEWDDGNLEHISRLSPTQIEQAIWNATEWTKSVTYDDRRLIRSQTDGGKSVVLIVQVVRDGVRPITGWEE